MYVRIKLILPSEQRHCCGEIVICRYFRARAYNGQCNDNRRSQKYAQMKNDKDLEKPMCCAEKPNSHVNILHEYSISTILYKIHIL